MLRRREEVEEEEEEEEEGGGAWLGSLREVRVRGEEGGRWDRVKEWGATLFLLLVFHLDGVGGRRRRWCGKEGGDGKRLC